MWLNSRVYWRSPDGRVSIRISNRDVGGRVVEMTETEYMVRGKGYLRGVGDLETLVVKTVPGTTSVYAERITGGYYLVIEPDRQALARYGLAIDDLQDVIGSALGGRHLVLSLRPGWRRRPALLC
jgi:Cu/Ag efflux pump CusA